MNEHESGGMTGSDRTVAIFAEKGECTTDFKAKDPVYEEVQIENTLPLNQDPNIHAVHQASILLTSFSSPSDKTDAQSEWNSARKSFITLAFALTSVSLLVAIIILLSFVYIQIAALRALQFSYHASAISRHEMEILDNKLVHVNLSVEQLSHELRTLSANTELAFAQQRALNEHILEFPAIASSCADILVQYPAAESGHYTVRSVTGQLRQVYCDMAFTCGNLTGGWMKIAELQSCPEDFTTVPHNGSNTCVRTEIAAGCTAISYSTLNVQYSHVCGKVRAYKVGHVNGFYEISDGSFRGVNISERYLDGVSLTIMGKHIWSYVASACNCSKPRPSFVGEDWTCDGLEPDRELLAAIFSGTLTNVDIIHHFSINS